ncbi:hypothetical protein AJ80_05398 [Polytolypa hystricis UAMH7299]|uniref:Uncharacterized protein n=1 Tax=Polytolypa hystricis (strain UAMH7299) TaxID=1447883 RepID=A0A2B7Y5E2_POLH7|nr:hypothetical protein AJ80_05398 [Polytolypa hystricis UAMH7299]
MPRQGSTRPSSRLVSPPNWSSSQAVSEPPGCLTQWFVSHRLEKTCPSCRAAVTAQPSPAYLVRDIVQIFISRAELLEENETTVEHMNNKRTETDGIEADKQNTDPRHGGLFRGCFKKGHSRDIPIIDIEDGVERCPDCAWELEDGLCNNCGFSVAGFTDSESGSEGDDSVMTDATNDVEDGFGSLDEDGFDFHHDALAARMIHINNHGMFDWPFVERRWGDVHNDYFSASNGTTDYDDEEGYGTEEEMDGFIDDSSILGAGTDGSTVVGDVGTSSINSDHSANDSDNHSKEDEDEDDDDDSDDEPVRPQPQRRRPQPVTPSRNQYGANTSQVINTHRGQQIGIANGRPSGDQNNPILLSDTPRSQNHAFDANINASNNNRRPGGPRSTMSRPSLRNRNQQSQRRSRNRGHGQDTFAC